MFIEEKIAKAIRKISAINTQNPLTETEQIQLKNRVIADIRNQNIYFENTETLVLKQNTKKRVVKQYIDCYSSENILCNCIKDELDKDFKIKYPNRNKITHALFGILPAAIQMVDFTIVKFDFKDFFNSISAEYVFQKYLKSKISDRLFQEVMNEFCRKTKKTFAGLPTSNSIAEIIATEFDAALIRDFNTLGVIYYSRYIDDSVLIINRQVDNNKIKGMLDSLLKEIFHDKNVEAPQCSTKFNAQKYTYISKRLLTTNPVSFDFLGYEFELNLTANGKTEIHYGITQEKQTKYKKRLEKILKLYSNLSSPDYQNDELLRHRVLAFVSREVYMGTKYKEKIWKTKGFISNYGELRFLLDTSLINPRTDVFLKTMVNDVFINANVNVYFSYDIAKIDSGYNLFNNMKSNKTLLFIEEIGYDYKSLVKLCKQVGINSIDSDGKRRTYRSLVREYLIKVKVGY